MSSHGPHGRGNRGGRGGRGGGTPIIDRTGVPRGVCSFYWSTGACNRSFDCTYKHEVKPQASSIYATETEDVSPDFFSLEGLAINNGSVMDSQHTLRPNEAHNYLKPYLADDFVFRGANNVEGFSRIFASVNSRNKAWDSNQAQAFLDTIVRGNALLRIGDVLRFSPVAVNVGAGSSTLSYQKGYFPIIEFLSSDLVLKTTMHQNTNMIYALLDRNYDDFHFTTRKCMREMIEARTWMDRSPGLPVSRQNTLSGVVVFGALSIVLSQYFARVKSAVKNHPELRDLVEDIISWFNIWTAAVRASPPTFKDPITSSSPQIRNPTLGELGKDISRLSQIVGREYRDTEKLRRRIPNGRLTAGQRMEALTSRLEQAYDPPGILRDGGEPRHDNDFADIRDIRIAPTNEELLCPFPPYLPVALPSAPHHLPEHSMERHLDIQFRLLREELVSSIRQSVEKIRSDLEIIWAPGTGFKTRRPPTLLEKLLSSKGGAYSTSGVNSVFFQLYTGACFAPSRAERGNFAVGITLDSPPSAPRGQNGKKRAEYWENSKRLQQGSLVALALISPGRFQVFIGTTVSSGADIAEFAKTNEETIQLRVSFFDAEIELMALRRQPISIDKSTFAVLIDNQIMFEALHPFLRTLKDVEPTSVPFSTLISYTGNLSSMPVVPPRYTRVPWFKYNLQCLARPGERISSVDVKNLTSVAIARQQLTRSSKLDPSQVDAVIGTLTREVSLIQGYALDLPAKHTSDYRVVSPPGTGKSFTGKEILRVLFASQIKPIVLIAFTNHALDHMLTSVLDDKITENVVRLGSRATDERIEQYSLYKMEQRSGRRELDRSMGREYAAMKRVEEEMTRIMNRIQLPGLTWEDTEGFLDFHYPQHADSFREPPFWISELLRRADADVSEVYGFWKYARDIEFIRPLPSSSNRATGEKRTDPDPRIAFFNELGFKGPIPLVPIGSRSVQQLTGVSNVWSMSICERQCLAESWEDEMRKIAYDSLLSDFDHRRTRYKDACKVYEDMRDEARRRLLSRTDLIACTTTGAAKLVSLLTSVGPKVLMVEEAGQVLEAHILASLVPSVEHLICIGDPKQLRPNLSTFGGSLVTGHSRPSSHEANVPPKALSMDSMSGRELFKFDRSLMERLSDGGMSMSQINVQRRMRPSISHFVRTILYPNLEDNEVVRGYPAVHGMEKNVVFFSHNNPENSEDDSVSKHNMFEVAMIRDLVIYLLKQGPYDGDGGIAVLCAYLGQLQKVRAALKDLKIAVSVDERDEEQLERTGLAGDDDMGLAQVQVAHRIRIGTVDTFQGQEAKIVIISLVRNSGTFEEGQASIGFLKTCVICLPDERKVDIVDFITHRRLDEIDLNSNDISERLIRLECGHIFTVGTLDGHCHMFKYYESDAVGAFTTTKAPPVDFQTPPSCPTCCRPITALRYGRVTKKANIDILEQNVASTTSSTLEEVGSDIESFLGRLDNVKSKAKLITTFYPPSHAVDFDLLSAHRRTRFGPESEPLSREEISQASMTNVHGFSVEEGRAWYNVVHDLLKLYRKIVRVARTRGPYEQAYDAAFATLYRLELSAIARDPEQASDTPERVAMMEVIKKIGQPPHKAGTRFRVEAFFLSFKLRYMLAEIAQSRIEGLNVFSSREVVRLHERLWRSFVSFIYESCIHDAEKALKIAKKSSASRLAAQAGVNILRGKLELFRFEILAQYTLLLQSELLNDDRRNELSTKAQLEANTASLEMKKLETRYLRSRHVTDTTQLNSERVWFRLNCREKGDKIVEEYSALATRLTQRECKPLTAMEDTRKAPNFSQHRRRFFGCISGHAFTIGTCGGAIEVARCPECSAISELPAWLGSIAAASLEASVQTVQRLGGWFRKA
ncbi:hypothetical protein EDB83DRAFT_2676911 [Lactarius deliciosus]|nr:hypothetical protein EDB83DRAFT_2676911 [Lactarius deliciosus]